MKKLQNKFVPATSVLVYQKDEDKPKFLMAKRLSKLEKNRMAVPGGKKKEGESSKQCAVRELKEEANLTTKENHLKLIYKGKQIFKKSKKAFYNHGYLLPWHPKMGKPKNMELDKREAWKWYSLNEFVKLKKEGKASLITGTLLSAYLNWRQTREILKENLSVNR